MYVRCSEYTIHFHSPKHLPTLIGFVPPIIQQCCPLLQQAIAAGSFFGLAERTLTNGDLASGFEASDHIIEGDVSVGAQEHFYMETQGCVAVPHGEDGEMEVFSSTQAPMTIQVLVLL